MSGDGRRIPSSLCEIHCSIIKRMNGPQQFIRKRRSILSEAEQEANRERSLFDTGRMKKRESVGDGRYEVCPRLRVSPVVLAGQRGVGGG